MRTTIAVNEPILLTQVTNDQPFMLLTPQDSECVCVRLNFIEGDWTVAVDARLCRHGIPLVVIACRVSKGDPGYRPSGCVLVCSWDTHVIQLEQVEKFSFRQVHSTN